MKFRILFILPLFAIFAAACAPSTVAVEASNTPLVDVPSSTQEGSSSLEPTLELTPTQSVDVLPAATSRGPELHATDPTTVNLATGQLHFVEFFRFT